MGNVVNLAKMFAILVSFLFSVKMARIFGVVYIFVRP